MQRVYELTKAVVAFSQTNPVQIVVYAEGIVTSSGWSGGNLGAWRYVAAPADGIQDFDFLAEEPTGITLPVLSPIAAELIAPIDPAHYWGEGKPLVGVRIHARSGTLEALPAELLLKDDLVPWPW